ncbi:unnamed protein product [Toxocara canis]|uniref:Heterogeneous nuclear ribonucleoprotein A1 n=1 Tax=Toxocara canis TaxID=6265 RepID=A0A183V879_TOXCA|nr:unnamed protein product [Toxocara canis]
MIIEAMEHWRYDESGESSRVKRQWGYGLGGMGGWGWGGGGWGGGYGGGMNNNYGGVDIGQLNDYNLNL